MKLSFKQVVEKVGANSSTLAFQRDKFAEFIPCSGEGRNRLYDQEAVEVLTITSRMYAKNKTYEEIKEVLENRYGVPADVVPVDNNITTTRQEEFIEAIRQVFEQELSKRDSAILHLQQELTSIKESLATHHQSAQDARRDSKSRDMDIMSTMRSMMTEKDKPWWQKLFRR